MNLMRYSPFTPMSRDRLASPFQVAEKLMSDMDRFWDRGGPDQSTLTSELYRSEDGKTYTLKVLVPGFSKEEISIDVSKNHISIDASMDLTQPGRFITEGTTVIRTGFPTTLSYREQIPATLDAATASAELKDGVLSITIQALQKESKGSRIMIK